LFANAPWRALAHLLVVAGFTLLLLMRALAPIVTTRLFPACEPTLEPWLFLRKVLGAMVLIGLALLIAGRRRARTHAGLPRRIGAGFFAALLGAVVVSGFLLEARKITSPAAFRRMTDEFAASADPAALASPRTPWASDYGVAFDLHSDAVAADVTDADRQLHDEACTSCHARPGSAFVSWTLARMSGPAARRLDAMLPFTTFFHVLVVPFGLLLHAAALHGAVPGRALPVEARVTRRALAVDARAGIAPPAANARSSARKASASPTSSWSCAHCRSGDSPRFATARIDHQRRTVPELQDPVPPAGLRGVDGRGAQAPGRHAARSEVPVLW
jgi:cytochrome c553